MIILPGYDEPRGRFLLPMQRRDWLPPSQRASLRDPENQTRWRLTARLNDGFIVWRGWFDDRDDADAFLWSMALGELQHEPDLWRLPTPAWHPDMGDGLQYEFATITFLTTTGTGTYTTPADCLLFDKIECLASAGAGYRCNNTVTGAGGGAAYAASSNIAAVPGAGIPILVAAAAVGTTAATVVNGGPSCFNGTSLGACTVGADAGLGGNGATGGTGGQASASVGAIKFNGGNGANGASPNAGAGGGAAGPNGAGASGTTSGGGQGDNGFGGAGGAMGGSGVATDGSNGTEWDATHGSGGGAGAYNAAVNANGKNGGQYGGGGGGARSTSNFAGGTGQQGIIVVKYTPVVGRSYGYIFG